MINKNYLKLLRSKVIDEKNNFIYKKVSERIVDSLDLTKINKNCVAPTVIDPVCGCDGFTYNNSTLAGCAGLISYSLGSCD